MTLRPPAADASLDMSYGDDRGPLAPDTLEIALYSGAPDADGVEINDTDCPGYERVTVPNDNTIWLPASGGEKTSVLVEFPASAQWQLAPDHFLLIDPATSQEWDYAPLREPMELPEDFDEGPSLQMTVFYDSTIEME